MPRLVVVGSGQLGTAFEARAPWSLSVVDRTSLDVRDLDRIEPVLRALSPDVVVNATAYNRVDEAEAKPELAFAVNATAAGWLSRASNSLGARFVHVSTDYVFDGTRQRPYGEQDLPSPLGVYGASKLAGEHMAMAYNRTALVVRTSGVFGRTRDADGRSFVRSILQQARAGTPLQVVADKTAAPTYAVDLARAILALVNANASGLVHATNGGHCTWIEFARAILDEEGLRVEVEPTVLSERPEAARRPQYTVLDLSRLESFGITMPLWRDGLRRYFLELHESGG